MRHCALRLHDVEDSPLARFMDSAGLPQDRYLALLQNTNAMDLESVLLLSRSDLDEVLKVDRADVAKFEKAIAAHRAAAEQQKLAALLGADLAARCYPTLHKHGVDAVTLALLSKEDVTALGLGVGDRLKLMKQMAHIPHPGQATNYAGESFDLFVASLKLREARKCREQLTQCQFTMDTMPLVSDADLRGGERGGVDLKLGDRLKLLRGVSQLTPPATLEHALKGLGLSRQYDGLFDQHGIDMAALPLLTEDDYAAELAEVVIGDRIKLGRAAAQAGHGAGYKAPPHTTHHSPQSLDGLVHRLHLPARDLDTLKQAGILDLASLQRLDGAKLGKIDLPQGTQIQLLGYIKTTAPLQTLAGFLDGLDLVVPGCDANVPAATAAAKHFAKHGVDMATLLEVDDADLAELQAALFGEFTVGDRGKLAAGIAKLRVGDPLDELLSRLRLRQSYLGLFQASGVDLDALLLMDEEDLRRLGSESPGGPGTLASLLTALKFPSRVAAELEKKHGIDIVALRLMSKDDIASVLQGVADEDAIARLVEQTPFIKPGPKVGAGAATGISLGDRKKLIRAMEGLPGRAKSSMQQLEQFLKERKLSGLFLDKFRAAGIDLDALKLLTEKDYTELLIPERYRKMLPVALADMLDPVRHRRFVYAGAPVPVMAGSKEVDAFMGRLFHHLADGGGVLRFHEIWMELDTDDSLGLSWDELAEGCRKLGYNPTEQDKRALMAFFDGDHNGNVDYKEFKSQAENYLQAKHAVVIDEGMALSALLDALGVHPSEIMVLKANGVDSVLALRRHPASSLASFGITLGARKKIIDAVEHMPDGPKSMPLTCGDLIDRHGISPADLRRLGMAYTGRTVADLAKLSDLDLVKKGVPYGPRKKLLAAMGTIAAAEDAAAKAAVMSRPAANMRAKIANPAVAENAAKSAGMEPEHVLELELAKPAASSDSSSDDEGASALPSAGVQLASAGESDDSRSDARKSRSPSPSLRDCRSRSNSSSDAGDSGGSGGSSGDEMVKEEVESMSEEVDEPSKKAGFFSSSGDDDNDDDDDDDDDELDQEIKASVAADAAVGKMRADARATADGVDEAAAKAVAEKGDAEEKAAVEVDTNPISAIRNIYEAKAAADKRKDLVDRRKAFLAKKKTKQKAAEVKAKAAAEKSAAEENAAAKTKAAEERANTSAKTTSDAKAAVDLKRRTEAPGSEDLPAAVAPPVEADTSSDAHPQPHLETTSFSAPTSPDKTPTAAEADVTPAGAEDHRTWKQAAEDITWAGNGTKSFADVVNRARRSKLRVSHGDFSHRIAEANLKRAAKREASLDAEAAAAPVDEGDTAAQAKPAEEKANASAKAASDAKAAVDLKRTGRTEAPGSEDLPAAVAPPVEADTSPNAHPETHLETTSFSAPTSPDTAPKAAEAEQTPDNDTAATEPSQARIASRSQNTAPGPMAAAAMIANSPEDRQIDIADPDVWAATSAIKTLYSGLMNAEPRRVTPCITDISELPAHGAPAPGVNLASVAKVPVIAVRAVTVAAEPPKKAGHAPLSASPPLRGATVSALTSSAAATEAPALTMVNVPVPGPEAKSNAVPMAEKEAVEVAAAPSPATPADPAADPAGKAADSNGDSADVDGNAEAAKPAAATKKVVGLKTPASVSSLSGLPPLSAVGGPSQTSNLSSLSGLPPLSGAPKTAMAPTKSVDDEAVEIDLTDPEGESAARTIQTGFGNFRSKKADMADDAAAATPELPTNAEPHVTVMGWPAKSDGPKADLASLAAAPSLTDMSKPGDDVDDVDDSRAAKAEAAEVAAAPAEAPDEPPADDTTTSKLAPSRPGAKPAMGVSGQGNGPANSMPSAADSETGEEIDSELNSATSSSSDSEGGSPEPPGLADSPRSTKAAVPSPKPPSLASQPPFGAGKPATLPSARPNRGLAPVRGQPQSQPMPGPGELRPKPPSAPKPVSPAQPSEVAPATPTSHPIHPNQVPQRQRSALKGGRPTPRPSPSIRWKEKNQTRQYEIGSPIRASLGTKPGGRAVSPSPELSPEPVARVTSARGPAAAASDDPASEPSPSPTLTPAPDTFSDDSASESSDDDNGLVAAYEESDDDF